VSTAAGTAVAARPPIGYRCGEIVRNLAGVLAVGLGLHLLAAPGALSQAGAHGTGMPAGAAVRPGREVSLPASEVRDTFFAWLLGIITAGLDAELDNATLRQALTEFHFTVDLPFDRISVVRHIAPRSTAGSMAIVFDAALSVPVPFAILWYHPGSIRASEAVSFAETRIERASAGGEEVGPVYLFRLEQGEVAVDVDDWIDLLFGSLIDDVSVRLVAVVRYRGAWCCLLGGTGREGKRFVAEFDFTRNVIQYPVPAALIRLGLDLWNGAAR
jgi:hypothetical protein